MELFNDENKSRRAFVIEWMKAKGLFNQHHRK